MLKLELMAPQLVHCEIFFIKALLQFAKPDTPKEPKT